MTTVLTIQPKPFVPLARPKRTDLPVAVIGAGPVGLAAAAHLLERGLDVVVYEAGDSAGSAVTAWGHTRLFSPWKYLIDDAARRLLDATGWTAPDGEGLPSGRDLVHNYLAPLASTDALAGRIRYGSRVVAVTRQGMDRTKSAARESTPFALRVLNEDGSHDLLARAVIDASGTYSSPNPLAANGLPLPHHIDAAADIVHALPDVLGTNRARFAGKRVMVVGAGHSAANTLRDLAALAKSEPGTRIIWAIRSANPVRVVEDAADELPARGALGSVTAKLVRDGRVELLDRLLIEDVQRGNGGLTVLGTRRGQPVAVETDVVVSATGFRPDLDILREVRLRLDEIVEAPAALAPLIDPNVHSCGTVPPHGAGELRHPEEDFFIVGMKSYGRAPTFLLLTGYEQVRSVAAEIAGDRDAAQRVNLVLPETGVCGTSTGAAACCSDSSTC